MGNKVLKLKMRKQLECHNGQDKIVIPKYYEFNAKVISYQRYGKEFCDFVIQPDNNLFKEETQFTSVYCDTVSFLD